MSDNQPSSDAMDPDSLQESLKQFAEKQHSHVAKLIDDTQKKMNEFKPFKTVEAMDEKVDELMDKVNKDLEKAMSDINRQLDANNG